MEVDWLDCNATRLLRRPDEFSASGRVLPSIFVPGVAKAGTSFLWGCIAEAFRPARICESDSTARWSQCSGRRYVLPALTSQRDGLVSLGAKEPFTFLDSRELDWPALLNGSAEAISQLLGPPLPLCQWDIERQATPVAPSAFRLRKVWRTSQPIVVTLQSALRRRMRSYCSRSPSDGCVRARGSKSAAAAEAAPSGRSHFRTAWPLASELGDAHAVIADGTPNYINSAQALWRIHWLHAQAPAAARFVVALRDPIERAISEYRMFSSWGWDSGPFAQKASRQVEQLAECWNAKFAHDGTLSSSSVGGGGGGIGARAADPTTAPAWIPLHERHLLARSERVHPAWVHRTLLACFDHGHVSTRYIRNSMPEVGLAAARAFWSPSQFMLLFMEDAQLMRGAALVARLAAFTGLTMPRHPVGPKCDAAAACASIVHGQRCQSGHAASRHGKDGASATARFLGNATVARLRRFFSPSLEALIALAADSFEPEATLRRLEAMRDSYSQTELA